ncbi:MAG: hypothetical protein R2755_07360 [Acidimicrobiales bacterium]
MAVVRPGGREGVARRRPQLARSAVVVVAVLSAVLAAGCGGSAGPDGLRAERADAATEAALEVVIPAGTGLRMDAGEQVDLLPAALQFHVGDVLRIVNDDDRTHVVGPFSVLPGETLTQRFSAPGVYQGSCTVHPDGQVELEVLP